MCFFCICVFVYFCICVIVYFPLNLQAVVKSLVWQLELICMKCILSAVLLTNSYFPCLRSNGCGEITLQLKTTAIYIIYNSKTADVIIYTRLIFYPRCCCAVIRTMQKSAGYKIYVPSFHIYMYLMSTHTHKCIVSTYIYVSNVHTCV